MKQKYTTSHYVVEHSDPICIYCNKPIKKVTDFYDERECDDYWPCNCHDAAEEQRLVFLISSTKSTLDKLQREAHNKNEFVQKKIQFEKRIEEIESAKRSMNLKINLISKELK